MDTIEQINVLEQNNIQARKAVEDERNSEIATVESVEKMIARYEEMEATFFREIEEKKKTCYDEIARLRANLVAVDIKVNPDLFFATMCHIIERGENSDKTVKVKIFDNAIEFHSATPIVCYAKLFDSEATYLDPQDIQKVFKSPIMCENNRKIKWPWADDIAKSIRNVKNTSTSPAEVPFDITSKIRFFTSQ